MEQKATPAPWPISHNKADENGVSVEIMSVEDSLKTFSDIELIAALRNAAPAMIEVLSCFREGDAAGFHALIEWLDAMQKESDFVISPTFMQMLIRHQKAASLMEGKGDDC